MITLSLCLTSFCLILFSPYQSTSIPATLFEMSPHKDGSIYPTKIAKLKKLDAEDKELDTSPSQVYFQNLANLLNVAEMDITGYAQCKHFPSPKGTKVFAIYIEKTGELLLIGEPEPFGKKTKKTYTLTRVQLKDDPPGVMVGISCSKTKIELTHKWPFRALLISQVFVWNGKTLVPKGSSRVDPNEIQLGKALEFALQGNLEAAEGEIEEGALTYPHSYLGRSVAEEALIKGAERSGGLYQRGRTQEAEKVLTTIFEYTTKVFSRSVAGEAARRKGIKVWEQNPPEKWLLAWKGFEIPTGRYIGLLNDLGFFLQKTGENKKAEKILRAVIQEAPERVPAYLNLADALWAVEQKEEAVNVYNTYISLMKNAGKEKQVPSHIFSRLNLK